MRQRGVMNDKIFEIKNLPLFKDVQNIENVFKKFSIEKYRAGENIDINGKLIYVISGSVLIYSLEPGRNLLLRVAESGQIFGAAHVLSGKPPISRAEAKGSCELVTFDGKAVKSLLETDKNFMYNYISFLCDRVDFLNRKITCITAGSSDRKLALYLSMFDSDTVRLDTSMTALSDMLDLGRASVYRSLEKLEKDGCIKRTGNEICISDRDLLVKKYLL